MFRENKLSIRIKGKPSKLNWILLLLTLPTFPFFLYQISKSQTTFLHQYMIQQVYKSNKSNK